MKSPITTHVLDTTAGKPATGVTVILEMKESDETWAELARGVTNNDGRVSDLLPVGTYVDAGVYRLVLRTEEYFRLLNMESFYPRITVEFMIENDGHYQVPLLLSPFGYSTYRAS